MSTRDCFCCCSGPILLLFIIPLLLSTVAFILETEASFSTRIIATQKLPWSSSPTTTATNSPFALTTLHAELNSSSGQGFAASSSSLVVSQQQQQQQEALHPPSSGVAADLKSLSSIEIKNRLLTLLPHMTDKSISDCQLLESYINTLEEKFVPFQTLDFFNLAIAGEWQFLFSTSQVGRSGSRSLRLRDFTQTIEPRGLDGRLSNGVTWNLAENEEEPTTFDVTGTFAIDCTYRLKQGARMSTTLSNHILRPSRGSKVPNNVPALVGLLHRAIPIELFDPTDLAMDITYLDATFRIVRWTIENGTSSSSKQQQEGIRNIFIRKGSMAFDTPSPSLSTKNE